MNTKSEDEKIPIDTGLHSLVMLLRFFEVPADIEQIQHQYGESGKLFDADGLLRVAKKLNLKAKVINSKWDRLEKTVLPVIAEMNDGKFFILARVNTDEGKILLQDCETSNPIVLTREKFEEKWSGRLLLITRRAKILGKGGKFDISWFIPALLRYKHLFYEVLIASFFLQLFALVTPLFFQVIIDKVLVHQGLTTLDVLIIGLMVVSIFEVFLGGLRTYIFSHTTNRVDVELGAKLFRHLLALPLGYFESRQVGQSVARVRELENIRNFITGSSLTLIIDLFFTIGFFAVMWYFSPVLTFIVLASIPFYVGLALFVTPILRARMEEKFQCGAVNQAFLVEAITGVETLKALAVEPQSNRKWEEQLAAYVHSSFKAANLGNIAGQATQLISKITMALTLYIGAKAVVSGDLTVGQLVAFNMLSGRVTGPILRLAQLWQDFQQTRISIERLGDILNNPTEPSYNPNRATLKEIKGSISFDHVDFKYNPDAPEVLKKISLDIAAGQTIGIVGSSGSGKSTLTKLVQRMYVPNSGRILVDGIELSMVDTAWLRRQVGVVLQENILFNKSVRENIALADPGLPMDRVVAAAKLSSAHEFITQLPEGYDTKIGERGSNLSGGQRQRIAIARALINNPRILIFDEATSALDYESEKAIQNNMEHICKGRTVLIIAHRLATVRSADRIVVLEAGQVIEDGNHKKLMKKKNGRYAHLFNLQLGA